MENLLNLKKLAERWEKSRNYDLFVRDGILNYKVWIKTNPKIMFLLKETADDFINISEREIGNEINITKGNGPHFWWNICYWKYLIHAIYNGDKHDFINQNELPEVTCNNNILDDIAYVNIKKNCENKTKSNDKEILNFAINDKEFLVEQIDLISPNVIFCSKVTFKAYQILYKNELIQINKICFRHKDRLVIKYNHPSFFQIKGGRFSLYNNLKSALIDNGNILSQFAWFNSNKLIKS